MENVQKGIQPKENKMGIMPVNKLIISMSLPMMISMLVQALYNVVDSVFVSQINADAFTALSMSFPLQSFMIAVGSGTGVGVNALVSRNLGEKRFEDANTGANMGVFLSVLSAIVFSVIGFTLSAYVFILQGADAQVVQYGKEYLTICIGFCYGIFGQFIFERLLQCTGRTVLSMASQLTGAVINIILDPILIFGLLGAPKLGVRGAALATVIGQVCACVFALVMNLRFNPEIKLSLKGIFSPKAAVIGRIYKVGVPSIIMASVGSVMNFGMNKILIQFSSLAVNVFGAYFKIQSFVFMPVFGLNNGLIPIISYNYGARYKERLKQAIRYGIFYAVGIMVCGMVVMECIPGPLLQIFKADEAMLQIGIPALRIISTSFFFAGFCIAGASVFQAFGKGMLSMIVSIVRQLVILLPAAYLLSLSGNVTWVWFAFPIAEVFSLTLTAIYLAGIWKKQINPMEDVVRTHNTN